MFFRWETGNNILAQEEGFLKELGPDPDEEGGVLKSQVQQGRSRRLKMQLSLTLIFQVLTHTLHQMVRLSR